MKKPYSSTAISFVLLLLSGSAPSLALAQAPAAAAPSKGASSPAEETPPAPPAGAETPAAAPSENTTPGSISPTGDSAAANSNTPEAAPPAPPTETTAPMPAGGTDPAAPSIEERLGTVEGKVEGMDESLAAARSSVDKLSRIKVSGYIQGRFESRGNSVNGVDSTGKPATTNQFLVRRGRLKTTYDGINAEYMLQIDATGSGVVLKDAEATFVDTWSPFGLRLTVGQFKWPFGYEILQSSGDREMPERSLVIRTLFPGERDRGLRLTGKYEWLRVAAALVNGTGTQDPIYPANDQNTFKDLVARVGGDFEWMVVGLSGYLGRKLETTLPSTKTTTSVTGTDTNMDGTISPAELTVTSTSMAVPAKTRRFSVLRLGADAQLYFDVPGLGGLALKGEFIFSKVGNLDAAVDSTSMLPIANSCLDVTSIGWILTAVQNIGEYVGAVLRIDSFDPNYSKAIDDTCPAMLINKGMDDRRTTVGGGLLFYGSGNIKGTVTYEHIGDQGSPKADDIFTAQLQARF